MAAPVRASASSLPPGDPEMDSNVVLKVNGESRALAVPAGRTLLDVLREDLDLTGAKMACDDGECGSCIVLLDDKPLMSCKLEAARARGKAVTTIEGLGRDGVLHPLQEAFLEMGATQCGFCIPGMIMRTEALLRRNPEPDRETLVKSLSRNMCRCTGYLKIFEAVHYGAGLRQGRARSNRAGRDGNRGVGRSVQRLDSPDTVDGAAKYAADLKMEGMLHARILRSPHHHARILSIDTSAALAVAGVAAVVTADDIPGTPIMSNCQPQTCLFPKDRARFLGEAIAAVAAETAEIAAEAVDGIEVSYEVLPAVLDVEDVLDGHGPALYPPLPNLSPATEFHDGDVAAGFAEADVIVEDTFKTARREHAAMEPEAALACLDENGVLTIRSPLYHPFVQGQESIANNLALDVDRVRVICPAMGGNFGKRGDAQAPTVAGLLALKTARPVRLVYSRSESLLGSSKTPSAVMHYRIGARKDGRVVALQATVHRNMGIWAPYLADATTQGRELCRFESIPSVLSHITGPYEIPNVRATIHDVVTNGPRSVPLRGTSGGYLPLAIESLMDRIAAGLDIDPVEFRRRNALGVGSRTHLGQVMTDSVGIRAELDALREPYRQCLDRSRSHGNGTPWRRGVGVGCGWRSITYVNMPDVSAAVELLPDGRVRLLAGSVEQGQGATTELAQIVSEALDLPMEAVEVTIGDTHLAPYPVPTFSSITTLVTGKAVQNAAEGLKEALCRVGAALLERTPEDIRVRDGFAFSRSAPDLALGFSRLYEEFGRRRMPFRHEGTFVWEGRATDGNTISSEGDTPDIVYGFNACVADLEVNVENGRVRLNRLVNAADPGTIIHPQALQGQIDGGLAFGIGIALSEAFHPDKPATLRHYGLPTTKDVADEVTSIYVEDPCPRGPFGAKSVAEMSVIAPVPAIINAIADATGARLTEIPATPDKVLSALRSVDSRLWRGHRTRR